MAASFEIFSKSQQNVFVEASPSRVVLVGHVSIWIFSDIDRGNNQLTNVSDVLSDLKVVVSRL